MTKQAYLRRIQLSLAKIGVDVRLCEVETIVGAAFQTVKDVVAEGDELHINGFGKFYGKAMSERIVKGGLDRSGKRFVVPARKKLGFSSFASTDRYIQSGRRARNMDGLFADVFSAD